VLHAVAAADVASAGGMGGALKERRSAGGHDGRQLRVIDSAVFSFRAAEPLTRRIANAIAAAVTRYAVTVGSRVFSLSPSPTTCTEACAAQIAGFCSHLRHDLQRRQACRCCSVLLRYS
jgi:hypothetical protein